MQAPRRKKEDGRFHDHLFIPLSAPKQMLKQMAENELKVYEEEVRDCRRAAGKVNQGRKATASRSSEEMMSSPATLFTLSLSRFIKENKEGV